MTIDWYGEETRHSHHRAHFEDVEAFGPFDADLDVQGGGLDPRYYLRTRTGHRGPAFGSPVREVHLEGPYPEGRIEVGQRRAEVALVLWRALACLQAGVVAEGPTEAVLSRAAIAACLGRDGRAGLGWDAKQDPPTPLEQLELQRVPPRG